MNPNTKAFLQLMAEQHHNVTKLNHQDGVFVLSDPSDVNQLIRTFQSKMPVSSQDVKQNNQSESGDRIAAEYHARLQAIEAKLKQYESNIAKDINALVHEFISLRQAVEQLARKQNNTEQNCKQEMDERDQRLTEFVQTIWKQEMDERDQRLTEFVQTIWKQEMDERDQRLTEYVQMIINKARSENQQTSWLAQLLGINCKK